MAWTTPATPASGELVTTTTWDEQITANMDYIKAILDAGVTRTMSLYANGTLASGTDKARATYRGNGATITRVDGTVLTAPTGQAIIADVHKGGTTIFTNQAHRLNIDAAANTGTTADIDVATLADGDQITVDIDQVGSGTAGSSLVVMIHMTEALG